MLQAGAPGQAPAWTFTRDKLIFTPFMWRPPQPVSDIDTMQPAIIYEVPRKG